MLKYLNKDVILILFTCILVYMPIFGHLDALPIRIWDEARLAISASEMNVNNNFLIPKIYGEPDMWSVKPPLMIWLQVVFIKLIGEGEVAIRLPSALAALGTCATIFIFLKKILNDAWVGFFAVLFLITTNGFIENHVSRTGDYDSVLIFFLTLGALLFFTFCETNKNKFLFLFLICLTLGVLTKGVSGLFFTPAFLLYALIEKKIILILKSRTFYFGLMLFLFFVLGYYLLREQYNPNYIKAVFENELGGRFLKPLEGHEHDFWYYFSRMLESQLSNWVVLIPFGFFIGLSFKNKRIKKLSLFLLLISSIFFLIISVSQTKLEWYNAPLFPLLAIILGVLFYVIIKSIQENTFLKNSFSKNILITSCFLFVFYTPYSKIIEKTYLPKEQSWSQDFYDIGYFLKEAIKGNQTVDNQLLFYKEYNLQNYFYIRLLQKKGINIKFTLLKKIKTNDKVIVCQDELKKLIEKNFETKVINHYKTVNVYQILAKKQT